LTCAVSAIQLHLHQPIKPHNAVYHPAGAAIGLHCDQKETVGLWETRSCCRDRRVCDIKAVLVATETYSAILLL